MASAGDWFDDHVGPKSSITEYINAPPRGMTWAPQNPKVRAQLAKELNELGVQLEHESWPPQLPNRFRSQESVTGLESTLTRSHSSPLDSIGASYSSRGPHIKVIRRGAFGDIVDHRSSGKNLRATEAPPKRIWSAASDSSSRPASKGYSRSLDNACQSSGLPTAVWRPIKVSAESVEHFPAAPRVSKKSSLTGKHTVINQADNLRVMTESELRNARDVLKGQSSLHQAAVADRFQFAADMSAGAPLCIRGAGTAKPVMAPGWASDASALINLHSGEMRRVAPSGLEAVKEQPKKKKKKKKATDDIDDLQLSDSGLFQPKYPIDNSLKSLRQLKRDMFPEIVRKEQEEAARQKALLDNAEEDARRDQANFFKDALTRQQEPRESVDALS